MVLLHDILKLWQINNLVSFDVERKVYTLKVKLLAKHFLNSFIRKKCHFPIIRWVTITVLKGHPVVFTYVTYELEIFIYQLPRILWDGVGLYLKCLSSRFNPISVLPLDD